MKLKARCEANMSVQDISPDIDRLEANLDKLEEAIGPLLENLANSSQLPLVDRAKLHTLTNYALESLIFCRSHRRLYAFHLYLVILTPGS